MGIRVDEMRELAGCLDPCVDRERLGCLGQQLSPDCQLLVTCQQKEPKSRGKTNLPVFIGSRSDLYLPISFLPY